MRTTPTERRDDHRRRSLLGATIRITSELSTTECIVRDISPRGARLVLSDAVPLPEMFDLRIKARAEDRRVRIVWRRGDALGVTFVQPRAAAIPVPLDLMRELRASRANCDALRLRLAAMERETETVHPR